MRETVVGPEVIVKPEVRCRGLVARFADDVVVKVAVGLEFKMDSDCVNVSWKFVGRKIFRKRSVVVSVGSNIECVVSVSSVAIYFIEFYHDENLQFVVVNKLIISCLIIFYKYAKGPA